MVRDTKLSCQDVCSTTNSDVEFDYRDALDVDGYCVLEGVLSHAELERQRQSLERILTGQQPGVLRSQGTAYGVRNLLDLDPAVVELALLPRVCRLIRQLLGPTAGLVRGLVFDKPPQRSWTLPWHRDRTVAVKQIPEQLGEFSNPTRKAGIPHVNAPDQVLEQMLTLRFALDPIRHENGPLVVLPGSHQLAADGDADLDEPNSGEITPILGSAGDVLVMRPLLAHSSLKSDSQTRLRRRIIHLELSGRENLLAGFAWRHFLRV